MTAVLVGAAGLAGVMARYGITRLTLHTEALIWSTVGINVVGSFLLGLLAAEHWFSRDTREALGVGFLALVGLTAAEATQVVGALLLLGLLAAPAGAAQRLTDRPYVALAVAGKATMWMAIAADVGVSLLVVANALRLLRAR